jgi:hypothetical protein
VIDHFALTVTPAEAIARRDIDAKERNFAKVLPVIRQSSGRELKAVTLVLDEGRDGHQVYKELMADLLPEYAFESNLTFYSEPKHREGLRRMANLTMPEFLEMGLENARGEVLASKLSKAIDVEIAALDPVFGTYLVALNRGTKSPEQLKWQRYVRQQQYIWWRGVYASTIELKDSRYKDIFAQLTPDLAPLSKLTVPLQPWKE